SGSSAVYTLSLHDALPISQEIPLRRGLIGAASFDLVLLELLLRFGKGLRTDDSRSRDGHPLLWGTRLPGIMVGAGMKFPPGLLRSEEHTSELQSLAYLVCR